MFKKTSRNNRTPRQGRPYKNPQDNAYDNGQNKGDNRKKEQKNYFLFWCMAAVVLLLAVGGCASDNPDQNGANEQNSSPEDDEQQVVFPELDRTQFADDEVLATYAGGQVTGEEFGDYLAFRVFLQPQTPIGDSQVQQGFMQLMILDRIIGQEMEGKDHSWAEEQTDELWEEVEQVYDEETLHEGYDQLQTTEEEIRQYILTSSVTQQYFREELSEEDRMLASVRHILISTEPVPGSEGEAARSEEEAQELAEDLYAQLQQGADFAELAEEYSEDPGSAENGGLYEDAPLISWVPEFQQAAFEQEVDEVGQPVKTDYGYHIIRVEDRYEQPLEEMDEVTVEQIVQSKFATYVTETLPEYIDEIHLPESS